jgi:ferrous iron transport protein B
MILAVSVVLWFLSAYPKRMDLPEEQRLPHSFVGYAGRIIEPVIAPLGFDWKMGIGIVSSFAAREVFVSAMGTVYNVGDTEDEKGQVGLREKMRADRDPVTGKPVYTPLVAICLMVYYVLAMQCMSTVAVVRRETNGWKWPLFQIGYMTGLAWVVTFIVYRVGLLMGYG